MYHREAALHFLFFWVAEWVTSVLVRKGRQWDVSSPPVASGHSPLQGAAALAPPLRACQQVYKHACSLARVTSSGLHADNVQLLLISMWGIGSRTPQMPAHRAQSGLPGHGLPVHRCRGRLHCVYCSYLAQRCLSLLDQPMDRKLLHSLALVSWYPVTTVNCLFKLCHLIVKNHVISAEWSQPMSFCLQASVVVGINI